MPLRVRKSKKIAPGVRVTVGKKSASVSVGGAGVRKTASTSGRTTTTVGVPGTGVSNQSTSSGCLGVLAIIILSGVLLAACGAGPASRTAEPAPARTPSPARSVAAERTALEMMEAVFGVSQSRIKAALDESLSAFDVELTEENYERAGSVLVSLANHNEEEGCTGCNEMAILEYMNRNYVPGVSMEWQEWAALSSTALLLEIDQ